MWDVESGSLHNIDRTAYLVAVNNYGFATDAENNEFNVLDKELISEIDAEFCELERSGVLNASAPSNPVAHKKYGTIKALCLHICHDCNLRCKYCFASEGTYKSARDHMSLEVGKRAVDFLITHSGSRRNLEIDFFGGEPLMNIDVVKSIVEYARDREKECGKKFDFTITTNCLLLNDELITFFNKEMHNVVLSIDGRREVHNNVRKSVNGKECYDTILANAKKFAESRGDKSYYVRGTFTSQNLDFASDIEFLRDSGFEQISVEPVVLGEENELAIREEHLPQILSEYERLAKIYLDSRKNGKWFNFFHFMIDLENGPCITKRLSGCGSGCEYLAVTPNGDLYPCHQFADDAAYRLGSVFEENLNLDKMSEFAKNIVNRKQDCLNCPAKYYCSGGCCANNIHFAGDMNRPYAISCAMMRKRFELSLAIAAVEAAQ